MFSIPQPLSSFASGTETGYHSLADGTSIPIIPVSEDSETIDYLLRLCYPVTDPTPSVDLATVAKVLAAALKYELEEASALLITLLESFVSTDPLRVFAVACREKLEATSQLAAREWKERVAAKWPPSDVFCDDENHRSHRDSYSRPCKSERCKFRKFQESIPGSTYIPEMRKIPAGCYFRLLRYATTGQQMDFCEPSGAIPQPHHTPSTASSTHPDLKSQVRSLPDIVLRSSDGHLVFTHQVFLEFSSAGSILAKARDRSCPTHEGLPLVDVDVDKTALCHLVQMCQPLGFDSDLQDEDVAFNNAGEIWEAARKCGMVKVADKIKREWRKQMKDNPVRAYLNAVRYRWSSEAKDAALHAIGHAQSLQYEVPYTAEMEFSPAEALYRLYKYSHEYQGVAASIVDRYRRSQQLVETQPVVASASLSHLAIALIARPIVARELQSSKGRNDRPSPDSLAKESNMLFQEVKTAVAKVRISKTT